MPHRAVPSAAMVLLTKFWDETAILPRGSMHSEMLSYQCAPTCASVERGYCARLKTMNMLSNFVDSLAGASF